MATVALGLAAAGVASAAQATAFVAAAAVTSAQLIGGYIDRRYLFRAKDAAPAQLDEFAFSLASEGVPMFRTYGAYVRVPGTVIWKSPIITTSSSGGSSKGGRVTNNAYHVSIAVAFADGQHHTDSPDVVWVDGKQIYNRQGIDVLVTSTQIRSLRRTAGVGTPPALMQVIGASGGPNMIQFVTNKNVTITGFGTGANNGTFAVRASFTASSGETVLEVRNSSCVTEAAGASVTVAQTQGALDTSRLTSLTRYRGSTTQTSEAIIESYETAGNVPGFRNLHYVLAEKLHLAPYGNRIPQFQALVRKESSAPTLGAVIGALLESAGLVAADYDVASLTGTVEGYGLPGPETVVASVARLLNAYNAIVQEVDGKLVFKVRTSPDVVTVTEADLAAHEYGTDAPRPFRIEDARSIQLPSEVNVSYMRASTDYQRAVQKFRRVSADQAVLEVVDFFRAPVVLTDAQALALAKRALWTAWANRQIVRMQLPPSYLRTAENDRLSVTADGQTYTMIVLEAFLGVNGLIELHAMMEQTQVL